MRELTEAELEDVVLGCALLATGGGGTMEAGHRVVAEGLAARQAFRLATLEELPKDGRVVTPYYCGSLGPAEGPGLSSVARNEGREPVVAVEALQDHLGDPFVGVVATEIGAGNTMAAWKVAAELALPLVDGDPAGRSVPNLEHSTYFLHGVPIDPLAVANAYGDVLVAPTVVDDVHAEALVRALAVASGGHVGVADHPVSVATAARTLLPGTVSLAARLGAVLREAGEDLDAAVAGLQKAAPFSLRFRGRAAADASYEGREGFTYGEMHLEGTGSLAGERYRIWFKNENLAAWRDDAVDLSGPDLICVLAPGGPVLNPHLRLGTEVAVLGLPAVDAWRSEKGVALLGPRAFGFDFDAALLPD